MGTELAPVNVKDIDKALAVYSDELNRALAGRMDRDYFLLCAATAIRRDPGMFSEQCRSSLMAAVFQSAKCQLPVGDGTQRACLVRYKHEVQFQLMFQGLIDLAYRSGQIKSISADLVFEGEDFVWQGTGQPVRHQPPWAREQDIDKMLGGYAQAETLLGGWVVVRMGKKELDGIKKRSKSFQRGKGPWIDFEPEMHKKTLLKRLCKMLPKSIFPQAVHSHMEQEDALEFRNMREAEIVVHDPAPAPDAEPLPEEVTSLRQSLKELLATLPPDKSDAILEASGIPKLEECTDVVLMRKAYKAAEEEAVA